MEIRRLYVVSNSIHVQRSICQIIKLKSANVFIYSTYCCNSNFLLIRENTWIFEFEVTDVDYTLYYIGMTVTMCVCCSITLRPEVTHYGKMLAQQNSDLIATFTWRGVAYSPCCEEQVCLAAGSTRVCVLSVAVFFVCSEDLLWGTHPFSRRIAAGRQGRPPTSGTVRAGRQVGINFQRINCGQTDRILLLIIDPSTVVPVNHG